MIIQDNVWHLYVGADNFTGEVNQKILRATLESEVDGYTLIETAGYYLGRHEPSVVVVLNESEGTVRRIAKRLADYLNQDSIGIVRISKHEMEFIS